jgi:hypothetical protein
MSKIQQVLIERAKETYQDIYPCSTKSSLEECFTMFGQKCLFWFNTADNSTHMIAAEIAEQE